MTKVLVVATSRKTRGGITSVINAHKQGNQWSKFHCKWIDTHRDGPVWRKILYFFYGFSEFCVLLPFYDIVHMHVSFAGSLRRKCWILRIAKIFGKKTIVHFHPPTPDVLTMPGHTAKYQYLFCNTDKVLVLSKMWINYIRNHIGYIGNNIEVLYNPCPTVSGNHYHRVDSDEKNRKYVLFAGTLIVRKGYKCLLRAFARIAHDFPDWRVVLAGVDEEHEAENLIKELGITRQVVLAGWCNKERMQELYRNAGIYCLASSGEGFPMVVLEAWAYGVPVVCTPVGGLPDILEEGVNALSFEFDDDETLSKQLRRMINDTGLRERLSAEGLRLAKDVFNINVINKKLGEIYQSLA